MPDIVVDTSEMADSLDHVSSKVGQTTLAVVAMQQEVCRIEEQSAQQICTNVNRGFFTLQHSQISQKKVLAMSRAEAQLVSLRQSAQSLCRVKEQMTRDFQRITSRYTKLFKSLNEALKTRIYAVDQPVSEVSDKEYVALTRRVTNCGGPLAVVQNEMLNSQIQLTVSRCKKHCLALIDNAKKLVGYNNELEAVINGISKDESVPEVTTKYLPVLIISSTDLNLENTETGNLIIGKGNYQKRIDPEIRKHYFKEKDKFVWSDCPDKESERVSQLVRDKISKQPNFDPRTREMMLKLLSESHWKTLGEVR